MTFTGRLGSKDSRLGNIVLGLADHAGSATGQVTWAGASTGTILVCGTASGATTYAGSAVGSAVHLGTAVGATAWTGAATGRALGLAVLLLSIQIPEHKHAGLVLNPPDRTTLTLTPWSTA